MEKRTKKGGNIRKREGEGDVINRGSGIVEKEARERKSGYTSVHLSTTWRRRLRGVEIGDPGSRWIL